MTKLFALMAMFSFCGGWLYGDFNKEPEKVIVYQEIDIPWIVFENKE